MWEAADSWCQMGTFVTGCPRQGLQLLRRGVCHQGISIVQSPQAAEGDCKPVTVNHPALMGRRWRAGYELMQNGLACKSNVAGVQKATRTEVSARQHPVIITAPLHVHKELWP